MKYNEIPVETALSCWRSGLCTIPASAEGKCPVGVKWTNYRDHLPSEDEVRRWFRKGSQVDAIVVPMGSCSKGPDGEPLFCLDADDPDPKTFAAWFASVQAKAPELAASLVIEKTPGGEGKRHVFWRAPVPPEGCRVLAAYADKRTKFETRFEGGMAIVTPSKSGGYHLLQGALEAIPTITAQEHALLLMEVAALDERPREPEAPKWADVRVDEDDTRPGSDFNRRGQEVLLEVLAAHGWKVLGQSGENVQLQRPDKEGRGISAEFNGVCLFNFSTSPQAAPFEGGRGYSPFHAFALLEHGSCDADGNWSCDYRAAADDLARRGFGGSAALVTCGDEGACEDEGTGDPIDDDPGPIASDMLECDGLIRGIADFTDATSARVNRILSLAGAYAFVAHLAGLARCQTKFQDRPNLFELCLAPSASGKSFALRTNRKLAQALGIGSTIATNLASGPGLEDAFIKSPKAVLATIDEMQKMLGAMRSRDSALANGMAKTMLEMYSASNDIYYTRKLALPPNGRAPSARPEFFEEPHLTVHACGIAELTFANLTVDNLTDGLLGRFLVFESEGRGELSEDGCAAALPETILDPMVRMIAKWNAVEVTPRSYYRDAIPSGTLVDMEEEAIQLRHELALEADRLIEGAEGDDRVAATALWGRSLEKAMKIALIQAVSQRPEQPVITKATLERAWAIACHSTRRLLYLAKIYTARNEYDEMAKRVLRHLKEYKKPMSKSVLIRKMQESVKDLDPVLETLLLSHQIVERQAESSGGRRPIFFSLAQP